MTYREIINDQLPVSDGFYKESTKEAYIEHFKGFSTSGSQCVGLGPESGLLLKASCKSIHTKGDKRNE